MEEVVTRSDRILNEIEGMTREREWEPEQIDITFHIYTFIHAALHVTQLLQFSPYISIQTAYTHIQWDLNVKKWHQQIRFLFLQDYATIFNQWCSLTTIQCSHIRDRALFYFYIHQRTLHTCHGHREVSKKGFANESYLWCPYGHHDSGFLYNYIFARQAFFTFILNYCQKPPRLIIRGGGKKGKKLKRKKIIHDEEEDEKGFDVGVSFHQLYRLLFVNGLSHIIAYMYQFFCRIK